MEILEIIGSVLLLITSLLIIIFVLAQNSGSDGMGALSGSSDLSGARENSNEAKAAKITKVLAIVFFVLSLAVWVVGIVK